MKKNISTIILTMLFIIGLSLLLYPTVSDYFNSLHQSRAITEYADKVSEMDRAEYERIWNEAQEYNASLSERSYTFRLTDEQEKQYEQLLNVSGDGVMGYVEIPTIKVSLPIYHGSDDDVLQRAIGHLEWSSLPVGGSSSHCVLSGHRGLPSAKLFTNLDQLTEGDIFILRVLDEVLAYEVDQILIVEPGDTDALKIVEGEDYCTLVTCTPYGINTHRLLVRGRRTDNPGDAGNIYVTADAMQVDPLMVAAAFAIPVLLILVIIFLMPRRYKKEYGGVNNEEK